jgi:hypothetical protein
MQHQAAEQIRQQIFGRKTHRDTAYSAESQQAGDAETQCLHHHQHGDHDHRDARYFAQAVYRGAINLSVCLSAPCNEVVGDFAYQPEQEPRDANGEADIAHRGEILQQLLTGLSVHQMQKEGETAQPDQYGQGSARRCDEGIVPDIVGVRGESFGSF